LKDRVRRAQVRAALAASAEMIGLYWQVGHLIAQMQEKEGWGAGVIPRLATDLRAEFPELEGFSERNLKRMIAFYREYPELDAPIVPQAAAQLHPGEKGPQVAAQLPDERLVPGGSGGILRQIAAKLPWFHHVLLIERVKD